MSLSSAQFAAPPPPRKRSTHDASSHHSSPSSSLRSNRGLFRSFSQVPATHSHSAIVRTKPVDFIESLLESMKVLRYDTRGPYTSLMQCHAWRSKLLSVPMRVFIDELRARELTRVTSLLNCSVVDDWRTEIFAVIINEADALQEAKDYRLKVEAVSNTSTSTATNSRGSKLVAAAVSSDSIKPVLGPMLSIIAKAIDDHKPIFTLNSFLDVADRLLKLNGAQPVDSGKQYSHPTLILEASSGNYMPVIKEFVPHSDGSPTVPTLWLTASTGVGPWTDPRKERRRALIANASSATVDPKTVKHYCEVCSQHFHGDLNVHLDKESHIAAVRKQNWQPLKELAAKLQQKRQWFNQQWELSHGEDSDSSDSSVNDNGSVTSEREPVRSPRGIMMSYSRYQPPESDILSFYDDSVVWLSPVELHGQHVWPDDLAVRLGFDYCYENIGDGSLKQALYPYDRIVMEQSLMSQHSQSEVSSLSFGTLASSINDSANDEFEALSLPSSWLVPSPTPSPAATVTPVTIAPASHLTTDNDSSFDRDTDELPAVLLEPQSSTAAQSSDASSELIPLTCRTHSQIADQFSTPKTNRKRKRDNDQLKSAHRSRSSARLRAKHAVNALTELTPEEQPHAAIVVEIATGDVAPLSDDAEQETESKLIDHIHIDSALAQPVNNASSDTTNDSHRHARHEEAESYPEIPQRAPQPHAGPCLFVDVTANDHNPDAPLPPLTVSVLDEKLASLSRSNSSFSSNPSPRIRIRCNGMEFCSVLSATNQDEVIEQEDHDNDSERDAVSQIIERSSSSSPHLSLLTRSQSRARQLAEAQAEAAFESVSQEVCVSADPARTAKPRGGNLKQQSEVKRTPATVTTPAIAEDELLPELLLPLHHQSASSTSGSPPSNGCLTRGSSRVDPVQPQEQKVLAPVSVRLKRGRQSRNCEGLTEPQSSPEVDDLESVAETPVKSTIKRARVSLTRRAPSPAESESISAVAAPAPSPSTGDATTTVLPHPAVKTIVKTKCTQCLMFGKRTRCNGRKPCNQCYWYGRADECEGGEVEIVNVEPPQPQSTPPVAAVAARQDHPCDHDHGASLANAAADAQKRTEDEETVSPLPAAPALASVPATDAFLASPLHSPVVAHVAEPLSTSPPQSPLGSQLSPQSQSRLCSGPKLCPAATFVDPLPSLSLEYSLVDRFNAQIDADLAALQKSQTRKKDQASNHTSCEMVVARYCRPIVVRRPSPTPSPEPSMALARSSMAGSKASALPAQSVTAADNPMLAVVIESSQPALPVLAQSQPAEPKFDWQAWNLPQSPSRPRTRITRSRGAAQHTLLQCHGVGEPPKELADLVETMLVKDTVLRCEHCTKVTAANERIKCGYACGKVAHKRCLTAVDNYWICELCARHIVHE